MTGDIKENCIEWYTGDNMISVTLTQKKYINRVKRIVEKYRADGCVLVENEDGSVWAKLPLRALHLTIYEPNRKGFYGGIENDA